MKIKLVSDLHLEFADLDLPNDEVCDVLVLGGDIMIAQDLHRNKPDNFNRDNDRPALFRNFLKRCSVLFPHVIYIAGNHEFYGGYWNASIDHLREECQRYPNIYFLENEVKVIDDVTFIGSTLWTDFNKGDPLAQHAASSMMNDYHAIRHDGLGYTKLRPAHTIERHQKSLAFIKAVVAEQHDKKFVVVGHHAPSYKSMHDQYRGDAMNAAYYSDLSEFILDRPQIKLWTHGHTHHFFDYMIGDTRIVCNPRGYAKYECRTGFKPDLVIEV